MSGATLMFLGLNLAELSAIVGDLNFGVWIEKVSGDERGKF